MTNYSNTHLGAATRRSIDASLSSIGIQAATLLELDAHARACWAMERAQVGGAHEHHLLVTLAYLSNDNGMSWYSLERLAELTRRGRTSLIGDLQRLEDQGLIVRARRADEGGHKQTAVIVLGCNLPSGEGEDDVPAYVQPLNLGTRTEMVATPEHAKVQPLNVGGLRSDLGAPKSNFSGAYVQTGALDPFYDPVKLIPERELSAAPSGVGAREAVRDEQVERVVAAHLAAHPHHRGVRERIAKAVMKVLAEGYTEAHLIGGAAEVRHPTSMDGWRHVADDVAHAERASADDDDGDDEEWVDPRAHIPTLLSRIDWDVVRDRMASTPVDDPYKYSDWSDGEEVCVEKLQMLRHVVGLLVKPFPEFEKRLDCAAEFEGGADDGQPFPLSAISTTQEFNMAVAWLLDEVIDNFPEIGLRWLAWHAKHEGRREYELDVVGDGLDEMFESMLLPSGSKVTGWDWEAACLED